MILILSEEADAHVIHVGKMLRDRGASFVRFDPVRFPSDAAMSLVYLSSGDYHPMLRMDGMCIDLSDVSATWYRRPQNPIAHKQVVDRAIREFIELECKMVVHDLWSSLHCAWLPATPSTVYLAEQKLTQLALAGALGFELPPTLVTNNPEELLEFHRAHGGRIVSKLAAKAFLSTVGDSFMRYTELVTTRDVAHVNEVALCPVTLQAYVQKDVELRITVVGERVFAAAIHSQATNHTRYDWRRYDLERTPHTAYTLPSGLAERCVKLCERLGVRYGAIDMVLTPDGRYVFLEINPNGQYLWIEHHTGQPISDAICDILMAH